MDFDSKGNLYFATGDNTGNTPNSQQRRLHQRHPQYTIPCPGDTDATYERRLRRRHVDPDGDGRSDPAMRGDTDTTPRRARPLRLHQLRRRAPDLGQHERLRGQAAAHQADGQPGRRRRASGRRTRSRAPTPRTAPNLFPPDSQAVLGRQGQARGVRHGRPQPLLDRRRLQDRQDLRRVGRSGPGHQQHRPGARRRPRTPSIMSSAGNYGWPYCQGGNRHRLPRQAPGRRPAAASRRTSADNVRGTVGGGADGQAAARFWDCDDPDGSPTTRRSTRGLDDDPGRRSRPTSGTARRAVATTSRATPTACRSTPAANTTRRRRARTAAARCCSAAARRR